MQYRSKVEAQTPSLHNFSNLLLNFILIIYYHIISYRITSQQNKLRFGKQLLHVSRIANDSAVHRVRSLDRNGGAAAYNI